MERNKLLLPTFLILFLFATSISLVLVIRYPYLDEIMHSVTTDCLVSNCTSEYPVRYGKRIGTRLDLEYTLLNYTKSGILFLPGNSTCDELQKIECYYDSRNIDDTLSIRKYDKVLCFIIILSAFMGMTFVFLVFVMFSLMHPYQSDDDLFTSEEEEEEEVITPGSAFITIQ